MYLTDSEEARLLALTMTGVRMALLTAQGTTTTPGTEVTGGSYLRPAVPVGTPSSSGVTNSGTVQFLNMPACLLSGWELWSSDGLQRRWFGYWAPTVALWNSDTFTTAQAHGLQTGQMIVFVLGQAPTGLVANQAYYVRDATSTAFKLAASPGGTAFTVAGTGSTTFGRVLDIPAGESFEVPAGALQLAMD